MTKKQKITERFLALPSDLTWKELITFLGSFGYKEIAASGSKRKFLHPKHPMIILHKPHPSSVLKRYQIDDIKKTLIEEGLIQIDEK